MITHERLKELIEQKATIWTDEYRGSHFKIKLIKHFVAKLGDSFDLYGYGCDYFGIPLNHLFETKEEAEWKAKTSRKRIENFEPLYYDHIDQNYCYDYYFSCKNHHEYLIRVSGKDIILFWLNCDYKEYYKNTKEEYEKLVLKCVKLFLGEAE